MTDVLYMCSFGALIVLLIMGIAFWIIRSLPRHCPAGVSPQRVITQQRVRVAFKKGVAYSIFRSGISVEEVHECLEEEYKEQSPDFPPELVVQDKKIHIDPERQGRKYDGRMDITFRSV